LLFSSCKSAVLQDSRAHPARPPPIHGWSGGAAWIRNRRDLGHPFPFALQASTISQKCELHAWRPSGWCTWKCTMKRFLPFCPAFCFFRPARARSCKAPGLTRLARHPSMGGEGDIDSRISHLTSRHLKSPTRGNQSRPMPIFSCLHPFSRQSCGYSYGLRRLACFMAR